ncbi:MAG TPA: response regulator transcription factor [Candidatus Limnocylindria bacterium]|nr:response regulator transcription factor [Candidatus Limnocylindria bacterium]
MAAPAVLVVDDDPNIRNVLRLYLERERYRVTEAADGPDAVQLAAEGRFDLILLDVMLPGYDGMEVTRRIREFTAVPILLLTARSGDSDKVVGLDLGADDYVVKPFSPRELMARVRAQIRRHRAPEADACVLVSEGLRLDPVAVRVDVDGRPVSLTATEFRILHALMERPARVYSRDELIDAMHGGDDPGIIDRTVDVHLGRLRRKLGDDADAPRFIETVRSVGYRFARPVEREEMEPAP